MNSTSAPSASMRPSWPSAREVCANQCASGTTERSNGRGRVTLVNIVDGGSARLSSGPCGRQARHRWLFGRRPSRCQRHARGQARVYTASGRLCYGLSAGNGFGTRRTARVHQRRRQLNVPVSADNKFVLGEGRTSPASCASPSRPRPSAVKSVGALWCRQAPAPLPARAPTAELPPPLNHGGRPERHRGPAAQRGRHLHRLRMLVMPGDSSSPRSAGGGVAGGPGRLQGGHQPGQPGAGHRLPPPWPRPAATPAVSHDRARAQAVMFAGKRADQSIVPRHGIDIGHRCFAQDRQRALRRSTVAPPSTRPTPSRPTPPPRRVSPPTSMTPGKVPTGITVHKVSISGGAITGTRRRLRRGAAFVKTGISLPAVEASTR